GFWPFSTKWPDKVHDKGPHTPFVGKALLTDHDAAARDGLRLGSVDVFGGSRHVVIDNDAAIIDVPDLDPKLVHAASAGNLAVGPGLTDIRSLRGCVWRP